MSTCSCCGQTLFGVAAPRTTALVFVNHISEPVFESQLSGFLFESHKKKLILLKLCSCKGHGGTACSYPFTRSAFLQNTAADKLPRLFSYPRRFLSHKSRTDVSESPVPMQHKVCIPQMSRDLSYKMRVLCLNGYIGFPFHTA